MIENNRNFKISMDYDKINKKVERMNNENSTEKLRSFSDIVYVYFLTASKKNNEKILFIDEETGEVIEDYKEKHRYLYCDTFTKTQVAKDLGISRPTLNKKLETLFKIGLIKESQGWSKEKKKYVPVWIFPPFNIEDFIDAKTANFFTELALYKNQYSKKGTMHEKIIELLFDLKRYWYAVEKNKSFYITNLLKDLNLSDKAENRIRIFDYLLLLQGLEIINFDVKEAIYDGRVMRYFVLTYFNDSYNKKMKTYSQLLSGEEEMKDFLNAQKRIIDFNVNVF